MARENVGKSRVTPVKHGLIYKVLARHAGALTTGKTPIREEFWMDLTAGNGVPYEGQEPKRGCSPNIFMHHAQYKGRTGCRTNVRVVLNELNSAAFSRLKGNVIQKFGESGIPDWLTLSNADARTLNLADFGITGKDHQGLILYADPNHIDGWVLTRELLEQCPKYTVVICTLGCNVGGLKRIPSEVRLHDWVENIESVQAFLPKHHDLGLFLVGDASQWAYLVSGPTVWRDRIQKNWEDVLNEIRKDQRWDLRNATSAWMRQEPERFELLKNRLVMTTDEFNAYQAKQTELFEDDDAA